MSIRLSPPDPELLAIVRGMDRKQDVILLIEVTLVTTFFAVLLQPPSWVIYALMVFFGVVMCAVLASPWFHQAMKPWLLNTVKPWVSSRKKK